MIAKIIRKALLALAAAGQPGVTSNYEGVLKPQRTWLEMRTPQQRNELAAAIKIRDAINAGREDLIAKYLSRYGEAVFMTKLDDGNPIYYAINMGNSAVPILKVIHRHLVSTGWSNKKVIEMFTGDGAHSYIRSATVRSTVFEGSALQFLMKIGVDVFVRVENNRTLLHVAARSGGATGSNAIAAIKPLVHAGLPINATDGNQMTPLGEALLIGAVDSAMALLEAGADPELTACGRSSQALFDHDAPDEAKAVLRAAIARKRMTEAASRFNQDRRSSLCEL